MKRSLLKFDYTGQISRTQKKERTPKPLSGKNNFSEQTSAKFVRPVPRTVGFAARGRMAKPQGSLVAPSERPARFQTCNLLGTVRELRTTDFKQVRPRVVQARRLNRSKLHRAYQ